MLDFIHYPDLGIDRDKFLSKVTLTVGKGNWFIAFSVKKNFYSWEWGMQLYEDAYWEFFRKNINLLTTLLEKYFNVFVVNRFDSESGLDYKKQTQNRDHYDDIAIRRCITRFGLKFKGKELLEIGTSDYSQTKVPFHLPHLMKSGKNVTDWINSNRFIIVAPEIEDKAKFSEMLIR